MCRVAWWYIVVFAIAQGCITASHGGVILRRDSHPPWSSVVLLCEGNKESRAPHNSVVV